MTRVEQAMSELDLSGYEDFDRLIAVVRRTHEVLDRIAGEGELPPGGADFLAESSLPHVERVQAGFQGSLRSDAADADELRYLLEITGAARVDGPADEAERRAKLAEAMLERALAARGLRPLQGAVAWDLALLTHARVVISFMPRLPAAEVRWPGRRSYADIPVPRGPAELAQRIEELERQLWRAATGRSTPPTDPAFRRTYGFFDTADRLGWRALRPTA
jgi:hypothetical protein